MEITFSGRTHQNAKAKAHDGWTIYTKSSVCLTDWLTHVRLLRDLNHLKVTGQYKLRDGNMTYSTFFVWLGYTFFRVCYEPQHNTSFLLYLTYVHYLHFLSMTSVVSFAPWQCKVWIYRSWLVNPLIMYAQITGMRTVGAAVWAALGGISRIFSLIKLTLHVPIYILL
jgi:hypothetical protein